MTPPGAELHVLIEGRLAGRLIRYRGAVRFRYEPEYRALESPTPLSVSMPVLLEEHPPARVQPWIAGLLPDNDRVIERWARLFRVSSSPFALLGSPVGEDCAGAVQVVPSERLQSVIARPGAVEWLTDAEVAERIRDLRTDVAAWLGSGKTGQFSLAGAQAKTALLFRDGRWGIPRGTLATTHILKPAITGLDEHDLNEHLCLQAARRAGMLVVETSLGRFQDESAIVVRRYDRREIDGRLVRIHQEDLCQALSVEPGRKYEAEGGPGPSDVIDLLRTLMRPSLADAEIWRFVDALIWNWLIAGTDAHAKNYSLLLSGPQVRLAPLYDVASALPYSTNERELRLAMRMGRRYDVYPGHRWWERAGRMWSLEPEQLRERALQLARLAPDAFADAARSALEGGIVSDLPGRLTDLVRDRATRCATVLTGPPKPGDA